VKFKGIWRSAWVRVLTGLSVMTLLLAGLAVVSYYLTGFVVIRLGSPASPLAAQVLNTLLAFFLLGLLMVGVSRVFQRQQRHWFDPIIDAINRIAQGDFSTRVAWQEDNDHPLGALARSVNNMAAELNQLEQMRQEFVANVSHEIQSPLTSIRGFARALREDDLDPATRRHYLGIIEAESMRLSKLSDNLLALASLDSDEFRLDPRPFRLDKQLRNLILACEPQWLEKGLDMDVALDEVTLTADEDLLSQVWINLLHNSIKFTPAGGGVRVALRPAAGGAEVVVADTGPGIAPEDQTHLFERFFKADPARRRSEGGNGLGLSIVKKIVDLHHGSVCVASQPGQGATFTVALPGQP
jgi:signal transduction histidine kinase